MTKNAWLHPKFKKIDNRRYVFVKRFIDEDKAKEFANRVYKRDNLRTKVLKVEGKFEVFKEFSVIKALLGRI